MKISKSQSCKKCKRGPTFFFLEFQGFFYLSIAILFMPFPGVHLCPPMLSKLFLVPIDQTEGIQMLYVFVDIKIDTAHFIDTLKLNFDPGSRLALVSTIQFIPALQVSRFIVQIKSHLVLQSL